jgi:hypothetical protein
MGRQVNFYATLKDMASLETLWRTRGPLRVLHSRSKTPSPRVLLSSDLEESGQRWLYFFLVRGEDVKSVVTREVPAQGYWTVDVVQSPVIELHRCSSDGKTLRRGRVYCVDGFYGEDGGWIDKPAAFKRWATSIMSATRRQLERHEDDYIGEDARAWMNEGGELLAM